MGINGVGKPAGAGVPAEVVSGNGAASGSTKPFTVGASEATNEAAGSDALARFQRGEVSLDEYLDTQVEAATAHLRALPAEQLDFIRQTLRRELENDPVLVELVRRTTGASPGSFER